MDFKIADIPGDSLRANDLIPLNYCSFICEFAKPQLLTSSFVDIIYHQRYVKGCTLRNIGFYVKKPVTLLTSVSKVRGVIDCMISGNMEFQLNGQERISCYEGDYSIFLMNAERHTIYLQPGTYELQRCEYSLEIIKRLEEETSQDRFWIEKAEEGKSVFFSKGLIWDEFYALQEELKHATVLTPLREEWFYLKLRELLVLTFEHDALILQKQ